MRRGSPSLVLLAMIAVLASDDSWMHAGATLITFILAIDAGGRVAVTLINRQVDKIEAEEKREEQLDIFR